MGADTKIEWATHTLNVWRGCEAISPACDHCYAEAMSKRNPKALGTWGPVTGSGTRVVAAEETWAAPLKWNKAAKAAGERHRVFCLSLGDVFEDWRGAVRDHKGGMMFMVGDQWEADPLLKVGRDRRMLTMNDVRRRLFKLISDTPHLDWLLLTKRPQNILPLTLAAIDPDHEDNDFNAAAEPNGLSIATFEELYPNVWLGTTVENQACADERIPQLLKIPAAVRFLSCEPLLGPVNLERAFSVHDSNQEPSGPRCNADGSNAIGWVIVGGESGHHARPMHPDWARSLRDQCQEANVPYFFKQWGEWGEPDSITKTGVAYHGWWEQDPRDGARPRHSFGNCEEVYRVGKKAAGRLLDGREWNEFPTVARDGA